MLQNINALSSGSVTHMGNQKDNFNGKEDLKKYQEQKPDTKQQPQPYPPKKQQLKQQQPHEPFPYHQQQEPNQQEPNQQEPQQLQQQQPPQPYPYPQQQEPQVDDAEQIDDLKKTVKPNSIPQAPQFIGEKIKKYSTLIPTGELEFDTGEFKVRNWKDYLDMAKKTYDQRKENPHLPVVKKKDFDFLRTLGTGAFSKVMLVKHVPSKTFHAAKLMVKSAIVKDKHVQHARNEKMVLQSIRFVFTIHLEYFFQDNVYLFYILPLVAGGELFTYLSKITRFKEDPAKFYTAQILLALEYLHYLGLIFRDLKPENILIDNQGYLKLADFGFCKQIEDRTYTFCGTSEYLAPEMLNCKGYGFSVDWWTFGIFIYELCAGYTPFYSKLVARTYENISRCKYKLPFFFSLELKDLIKNILQIDLSRRFGNLKNGVNDIKDHKWYSAVSWTTLLNRQIRAPFIPIVARPDDTSNFMPNDDGGFLEEDAYDVYHHEFANF